MTFFGSYGLVIGDWLLVGLDRRASRVVVHESFGAPGGRALPHSPFPGSSGYGHGIVIGGPVRRCRFFNRVHWLLSSEERETRRLHIPCPFLGSTLFTSQSSA